MKDDQESAMKVEILTYETCNTNNRSIKITKLSLSNLSQLHSFTLIKDLQTNIIMSKSSMIKILKVF